MTDLLSFDEPVSSPKLDTAHAREMVRKRYAPPEWVCMLEVAPSTGGGTRYADAVAMNLWSSRGHAIVGMEIKVSRSDWLRELKKPEKAEESVYRFCDQWFIVAPKGVVKDGELPPNWGLLELRAGGLTQIVAAPKLEPKPLTRGFFASLVRRSFEQLDAVAAMKLQDARREDEKQRRGDIERAVAQSTRHHKELLARLEKVKKETGLDFGGEYDSGNVGPAVIRLATRLAGLQGWREKGAVLGKLAELSRELEKAAQTVRDAYAATELDADFVGPMQPWEAS